LASGHVRRSASQLHEPSAARLWQQILDVLFDVEFMQVVPEQQSLLLLQVVPHGSQACATHAVWFELAVSPAGQAEQLV